MGFAHVYHLVDASNPDEIGVEFPGMRDTGPTALDYVYLSFALGTAFATSDPSVRSVAMRRVVLLHSVVAFFYNALVLAVAFEVLQQLIA
ncbi:DUF1345 domain-containing protein [Rhodococcus koreensis]